MNILQVNTFDKNGGAEQIAYSLHSDLQTLGYQSTLAVGWRQIADTNSIEINSDLYNRNLWRTFFLSLGKFLSSSYHQPYYNYFLRFLAQPKRAYQWLQGEEDFDYPVAKKLLDRLLMQHDLIHLHNLHGNYFDLHYLAELSKIRPVLITLHDEWLYTGYCRSTAGCERWQKTCGHCPLLSKLRKDNTPKNLSIKKDIYSACKFYISTPSKWLLERTKQSILAPAIIDSKVINNGIDPNIFKSVDKYQSMRAIDIDNDVFILLFVANAIKSNSFKDHDLVTKSVIKVAPTLSKKIVLLMVGESDKKIEHYHNVEVHYKAYVEDLKVLANYYQAADIYLHAAKSETWGLTITEAMACGTPVIATAVGGIPEQIISLNNNTLDATGILVKQGDIYGMSESIKLLLKNNALRQQLARNAAIHAKKYFDKQVMLNQYIDWYKHIINNFSTLAPRH